MNKYLIKIAENTLVVLKKKLWEDIKLEDIKGKTKIKSFNKLVNTKKDLLKILNNYFDYKLSLESNNIEDSNNKDMIFEILMMRFDLLQQHRKGVISIFNSFKKKPNQLIFLLPDLLDSIILMMNYTKLSSTGITGQLKIKGVLIIYLSSFLVWVNDNTSYLEKTMTALDNYLNKAEKILKFIK